MKVLHAVLEDEGFKFYSKDAMEGYDSSVGVGNKARKPSCIDEVSATTSRKV